MTDYVVPTLDQVREISNRAEFSVVSLFAGGGGSSTGYRMAGGKVLAVNEFIPEAVNTYKANWPETNVIAGDIRKITANDLLEAAGVSQGQLDILDGSPPCSAFSTAGSRDKGWGKTKKYSDATQERVEDLFFEYIRMVRGVMPKVFVAENVAGLAKGVAKGYLNQILRELRLSGYHVECRVLDARFLGVPQSRTRTIFVGIRDDLFNPSMKGRLHPRPMRQIVSLEDAFKGLTLTDADKVETNIEKYAVYGELKKLKLGGQSQKYFQLVKAHPKMPSGCITASSGNTGIASVKHWDNRAFTVSEVKRIMSIPDDYILTGTYKQKVERLGRMVAPFMMKAIAENIKSLEVLK